MERVEVSFLLPLPRERERVGVREPKVALHPPVRVFPALMVSRATVSGRTTVHWPAILARAGARRAWCSAALTRPAADLSLPRER
jgi:hypothetical protein